MRTFEIKLATHPAFETRLTVLVSLLESGNHGKYVYFRKRIKFQERKNCTYYRDNNSLIVFPIAEIFVENLVRSKTIDFVHDLDTGHYNEQLDIFLQEVSTISNETCCRVSGCNIVSYSILITGNPK